LYYVDIIPIYFVVGRRGSDKKQILGMLAFLPVSRPKDRIFPFQIEYSTTNPLIILKLGQV